MSYKTILVHLNHETRAARLLEYAIGLAQKFEAHLIGLHAFPAFRLTPPIPLPFSSELAARIQSAIKQEDARIKTVFDDVTANQPFTVEWRSVTSEHRDAAATVLDHARPADIVIASQADPSWEMSDLLDFPDRLALGAGRPVIVVPNSGPYKSIPRAVTLAWNDRREAAAAVTASLPLLKLADTVYLLAVSEGRRFDEARTGERDVELALKRHGVHVAASRIVASEFTVGEEIRVRAIDNNADLLVMGCYGHSRMREMAFGGVTRHMLREVTIPVLFSH